MYKLVLVVTMLFVTGCMNIPKQYPKSTSSAYKGYTSTSVGKVFERESKKHPGKSGFDLIRHGREAFTVRIAMTEMAEKTLDLQYYLWERDETGRLLAYYVLKAADRGVKVRVLLDDIGLETRDKMLASLDAHPNIEIRIFNPFTKRSFHSLDFLTDFNRLNHRMHNKTFIMDNALVIVGGRNIGNHYFGVDKEINFRDLDIVAGGPIVREVSKVYDYFWNGNWSVPMNVLANERFTPSNLKKARKILSDKIKKGHYPYPLKTDVKSLRSHLASIRRNMIWAKGSFVWNDPKLMKLEKEHQHDVIIDKLNRKLMTVTKRLDVESPYFIPGRTGTAILESMRKRGVKINILTNSQKSNDVEAAFAGYEHYRKALLAAGVDLYELRPDAGGNKIINKETKLDKVTSGLHAKALVFDAETLFVGSFNLDPRSSSINTEGGLYVESPRLAKKVLDFMAVGRKPENAYRLQIDKQGDIVWIAETNGKKEIYHSDPHTNAWDHIKVEFIQAMPVEDQL